MGRCRGDLSPETCSFKVFLCFIGEPQELLLFPPDKNLSLNNHQWCVVRNDWQDVMRVFVCSTAGFFFSWGRNIKLNNSCNITGSHTIDCNRRHQFAARPAFPTGYYLQIVVLLAARILFFKISINNWRNILAHQRVPFLLKMT